jgi:Domain of unknown function (DUF4376)
MDTTDVWLNVVDDTVVAVVEHGLCRIGDNWVSPSILEPRSAAQLDAMGLIRVPRKEPAIDWNTQAPDTYAPQKQPDGSWAYVLQARQLTAHELAEVLSSAKSAKLSTLSSAYAAACTQPVSFTTAGKISKTFQADVSSTAVLQQTLAGLSGPQATPPGFFWVSADNTAVPFSYADLQGLAGAILAQGWAAFQALQTAKAAVNAATTVAQAQAVAIA